ncbi:hypothetical protein BaRGS_00011315 [Batillaria attramentaria]|uniref:Uncharacterized protein n=1 Tax=Batillaria attramentaria TaxID=370345 RepID=A0ABD0LE40_9CAEN
MALSPDHAEPTKAIELLLFVSQCIPISEEEMENSSAAEKREFNKLSTAPHNMLSGCLMVLGFAGQSMNRLQNAPEARLSSEGRLIPFKQFRPLRTQASAQRRDETVQGSQCASHTE